MTVLLGIARLAARGFSQKKGIDYKKTFSRIAWFDSIRTILFIASVENLKLSQFDIKSALLNADVEEYIYIGQSQSFEDKTYRVCKLQSSLYGLKQAFGVGINYLSYWFSIKIWF